MVSFARTLSLYRVISIFMNLETAKPCRPIPGFLDAPLPAAKTLWNAPTAVTWKKEFDFSVELLGNRSVLTNGKLVLMQAGADENKSETGWDDWLAGIDGLGLLVIIATSMLA
jgi:hypothetical protein